MAMPIRLLIADDHPVIADALGSGIQAHEMEVVGRTTAASDVRAKYAELLPDVLVLDVRFGRDSANTGLDVAREILGEHEEARIVIYSQFDSDEMIREAYRIGVSAFVPKSTSLQVVAEAIVAVHTHGVFLLPHVAQRIALLSIQGDDSPQALLESRELEVFRLLAKGSTNIEIAEKLDLSAKTISHINQAIKEKLGVQRPADITLLAVKHELIAP